MENWLLALISAIAAVIASTGFWTFLIKRSEKKDAKTKLLIGIAHDRIMWQAEQIISRGYITPEEYENLNDYLYVPYSEAGGNGTAKKIMDEIRKLPMHPHPVDGPHPSLIP